MKRVKRNSCIALTFFFFFLTLTIYGQATGKSKQVKNLLPIPFGTITKLTIQIVDGDQLGDKGYQSAYLFKIKTVDSVKLSKPVLIEFKDETGKFPADEFQLYKYVYGRETGSLTSDTIKMIKKEYVGKSFTITAYETGEFTGIPDNYFNYQPVRQDRSFYFRHYIIVVADLSNNKE